MDLRRLSKLLGYPVRDNVRIKGRLIVTVFGPDGKIKQQSINHNIETDHGDALVADAMATTHARTPVNNANGRIGVGTGYVGGGKSQTNLVAITGSAKAMDATYPKLKGAYGAADDNVVQYQSTFSPGDLNAIGINEAILINGAVPGVADDLAYAEVTPAVNAGLSDTVQILWELTYYGV